MSNHFNSTFKRKEVTKSSLKRTPMKRGGRLAVKKPLRKKSIQSIAKVQRSLWEAVRGQIRAKHGNTCYTCDATGLEKQNWQCGHLWPKASLGAFLKYDERVLRPQCFRCNINMGGMGAEFYKRILAEIGPKAMRKLEEDKKVTVKAMDWYQLQLKNYAGLS